MGIFTAIAVISIVAIVTECIIRIVKIGTKFAENVERIKHGYPTIDGTMPINSKESKESKEEYHN